MEDKRRTTRRLGEIDISITRLDIPFSSLFVVAVHCDKWFGFGDSVLVIAFSLMMMMIMNLDKDSSGNKMFFFALGGMFSFAIKVVDGGWGISKVPQDTRTDC